MPAGRSAPGAARACGSAPAALPGWEGEGGAAPAGVGRMGPAGMGRMVPAGMVSAPSGGRPVPARAGGERVVYLETPHGCRQPPKAALLLRNALNL